MFERILGAPGQLLALEGPDSKTLIDQFRTLVRHSGQAVYLWDADVGLSSLREAQARVPGSQRLGQALRFVQQSIHFGVYLFLDLPMPLAASDMALLRQFGKGQSEQLRRVVLVDPSPRLLEGLDDVIERIDCAPRREIRPRLRDGRWLL